MTAPQPAKEQRHRAIVEQRTAALHKAVSAQCKHFCEANAIPKYFWSTIQTAFVMGAVAGMQHAIGIRLEVER